MLSSARLLAVTVTLLASCVALVAAQNPFSNSKGTTAQRNSGTNWWYQLVTDPRSWEVALIQSRMSNGDTVVQEQQSHQLAYNLAAVTSANDVSFMRTLVPKGVPLVWINGAYSAQQKAWLFMYQKAPYTNWRAGEPNNPQGIRNCVAMDANGLFVAMPCWTKLPYIVEYFGSTRPGADFWITTTSSQWAYAQNANIWMTTDGDHLYQCDCCCASLLVPDCAMRSLVQARPSVERLQPPDNIRRRASNSANCELSRHARISCGPCSQFLSS